MRIYYVFSIKKEYISLYKDSPNSLYNVLYQIYYMRKKDIEYGFNLFNQLINRIDKTLLDKKLFIDLHKKMSYVKKSDTHIINNLYKDEVSVLKVKKAYILINTNRSYTEFFNILSKYDKDLFVCDFINNDYFYISDIKMLV